jgi:NADPH:quinone reductase-like Zn-dependent oxidoreductase
MSTQTIELVRMYQNGDAAVLEHEQGELTPPAAGEVRIRQHAVGVNFVDIYQRNGLYPVPELPATLGVEGAGVIEALGPGVSGLAVGQRVAYAYPPVGGYASARNLPAERVMPLPDEISFEQAAGAMLRGLTVHMLFNAVRPFAAGDTVLVHAAAGGLGLLLVQWAKALGARVIGTVGSQAKAELALAHGLDRAVRYKEEDFVAAVRDFTDGEGVHYAIDGIGGDTLLATLDAVRPYGMVASIGQVAGASAPIDLAQLGPARSIALARPSVFRYVKNLARYRAGAEATLARLAAGMQVEIGHKLPLAEAAAAQRLLESGVTSGSVLLIP